MSIISLMIRWIAFCFVAVLLAGIIAPKQSFAFLIKDQQAILEKIDDFYLCLEKVTLPADCHNALLIWVKNNSQDAFLAGQMTRKKMHHWLALTFFHQAFLQKQGNCQDEDLKLAVLSGLNLPVEKISVVNQAKEIGLTWCFPELKQAISKEAKINTPLFANVCKTLLANNMLSGLKQKKCEELP